MKKWMTAVVAAVLAVCLCACGAEAEPQGERVEVAPVLEQAPASDSDGAVTVVPASDTDTAPEEEPAAEEEEPSNRELQARFEQAEALIGHPVQELFEYLGEPESSQYAASCEVDGGEDGMQFYDGFYVWTLRTEDEELVRAVYLDE